MAQYGGYQNRNHSHQHQRYASSPIDYRPQTNPSPARAANFVKQTSSEAGAYQSQHVGRPTNTRHRRYYSADIPSEALPSTVLPTAARARLQYTAGISASQSRHQPQTQTQARARQVLQQGEWESLRQRGYVLRGTADINIHTATAPSVVSTPVRACLHLTISGPVHYCHSPSCYTIKEPSLPFQQYPVEFKAEPQKWNIFQETPISWSILSRPTWYSYYFSPWSLSNAIQSFHATCGQGSCSNT